MLVESGKSPAKYLLVLLYNPKYVDLEFELFPKALEPSDGKELARG